MEYKKHYTDEELNAVKEWFNSHWELLPDSVQSEPGIFIKNLRHTVTLYYDIMDQHKDNPTYSAQILQVFKMKDAAEKVMREKGLIP